MAKMCIIEELKIIFHGIYGNNMNKLKFLSFCVLLFPNCKTHKTNMGHVVIYDYIKDSITNKPSNFLTDGCHFWFKDNLIVVQNITTNYYDSSGVQRRWDEVYNYVFYDQRTKQFYEYLHFSDIAVLQSAYTEVDEIKHRMSYRLYKERPSPILTDSIIDNGKDLTDTIIGDKTYQRFRFGIHVKDARHPLTLVTYTLYFDCKGNGTLKFYKWLSDKRRCPVIRFDEEIEGNLICREITTISKALTNEQSKTFDVWEKYAKEHLIK